MSEISDLKKQLKVLDKKQIERSEINALKGKIKAANRQESQAIFDKKHKVLGFIGKAGAGLVRAGAAAGKKIGTPLTPQQQARANKAKRDLQKLINM